MPRQPIEILLVEDDANDLTLTLHALNEAHVSNKIQIARNGEEALDFLFCQGAFQDRDPNDRPKLVLMDLKLPKVGGLEVLNQLRGNARTRMLPVVILTSSNQEEDLVRSYRLGVNSYIQKPVDFDQFRQIIKHLGYYWIMVNQTPPNGWQPA